MNLSSLLGKKLKDDDILDVLEDYEIEVVYDFDRSHENIEDIYWAPAKDAGVQLRFDQSQILDTIFCYAIPLEGFSMNAPDYLNPDIPSSTKSVTMPIVDATAESLRGYGSLVESPDDFPVEIVRWPAKGWRPVDADSGNEAGTTEGIFTCEWRGDILFGRNEAVGGHYILCLARRGLCSCRNSAIFRQARGGSRPGIGRLSARISLLAGSGSRRGR